MWGMVYLAMIFPKIRTKISISLSNLVDEKNIVYFVALMIVLKCFNKKVILLWKIFFTIDITLLEQTVINHSQSVKLAFKNLSI